MYASNIYYSLYVLKPTDTLFFDDTSKPYYDVWIGTTPPPWLEEPDDNNGHSGGGAQTG